MWWGPTLTCGGHGFGGKRYGPTVRRLAAGARRGRQALRRAGPATCTGSVAADELTRAARAPEPEQRAALIEDLCATLELAAAHPSAEAEFDWEVDAEPAKEGLTRRPRIAGHRRTA